jgi:hypothetical protein
LEIPVKLGLDNKTDQSWARHPRHEPLATLQLGADNPAFLSGAADYATFFWPTSTKLLSRHKLL